MIKNNTFKQLFSLSKPLFCLLLLISFSCANAALPASVAVASPEKMQTYRIQKGDTLWDIANKFRQDSTIAVEQVMLALLKENPKAFSQGNVYGIKSGYVLRMPGIKSIKRIDRQHAIAEVKKQAVLWRRYQYTALQSGAAASMGSIKSSGSGSGSSSELLNIGGSIGDKVVLPEQAKTPKPPKTTNWFGRLSSTDKSVEAERYEEEELLASLKPENMEDLQAARAEQVVREKEVPMVEREESQKIKSKPDEPAPADDQQMADESDDNKFDEYSVLLKADKKIVMPGLPGILTVWIGDEDYKPGISDDKVHDEATIAAVGHWAIIEPFSTAFIFEPAKSECIKIHSTGSEERFQLTPKDKGVFEVGAKVNLYDTEDCSKSPVPKSSSILKVTVEVDNKEIVFEKINELWAIFWEKFLEFWGAFLVVSFGLIMFLYKNKLKRIFKFDSDKG